MNLLYVHCKLLLHIICKNRRFVIFTSYKSLGCVVNHEHSVCNNAVGGSVTYNKIVLVGLFNVWNFNLKPSEPTKINSF